MRHVPPDKVTGTYPRRPAMARVHAANASLHAQAVRGLARSLTRPAYQRLLEAEPLLRRAVPLLIVAFLVAVAIGAAVQIAEHRSETLAEARENLALITVAVGEDLIHRTGKDAVRTKINEVLRDALPSQTIAGGRRFYVTDSAGQIL